MQQKHLDKELIVLHRSVRVINDELMENEADQKSLRQLLEDLGLTQSNIVKTPRTVEFLKERERQRFGAEPCDVRARPRTVWTALKQSTILHERCRNRQQVR